MATSGVLGIKVFFHALTVCVGTKPLSWFFCIIYQKIDPLGFF